MSSDSLRRSLLAQELHHLGLGEYVTVLSDNGFDSWAVVCNITQDDLDRLGFNGQSQYLLKRRILEFRARQNDLGPFDGDSVSAISPTHDGEEQPYSSPKTRHVKAGTGGKRRYRRHPKPDVNAPRRPLTAYASFANHVRSEPAISALTFVQIAREVGKRWQSLAQGERNTWEQQATSSLNEYKQQVEKYKTTEQSRAYQRYFGDFKRQQQSSQFGKEDVDNAYDLPGTSQHVNNAYNDPTMGQQERRMSNDLEAPSTTSSLSTASPSTSDMDFASFARIKGSRSFSNHSKTATINGIGPPHEYCVPEAVPALRTFETYELGHPPSNSHWGYDAPLTRLVVEFRDRCRWLIEQGTPFAAIAGPDYIDVSTFFDKTRGIGIRVDSWACCVNRTFTAEEDVFVLLACIMFHTSLMRWMICPSAELYNKISPMLQLTELQRIVSHPCSLDMVPIPALRDAMIRDFRGTCLTGPYLSVNWPYSLEGCIERYDEDGSLRLSNHFIEHAMQYENWSIKPRIAQIYPELEGRITIR